MRNILPVKQRAALLLLGLLLAMSGTARGDFQEGHIFVAGSRDAAVFEFDADFNPVSSWTHPSFGTSPQSFVFGPAGMAFDADGNLVVAARSELCVFSAPDVVVDCHPKTASEPTEALLFDSNGTAYTTTSTGGTNQIQVYNSNLDPVTTFSLPTGDLTGMTCDPTGNLYIASAECGCIYKVDRGTFIVLDTISGFDAGVFSVEGIQYTSDDDLLVAHSGDSNIRRIEPSSPLTVLDTVTTPNLDLPVSITIDNQGNIYTGDYESGTGILNADLFKFDPGGTLVDSIEPSTINGPFGTVVAGTVLPCGAFQPDAMPASTNWSLLALFLLLPTVAALVIWRGQPSRPLPR